MNISILTVLNDYYKLEIKSLEFYNNNLRIIEIDESNRYFPIDSIIVFRVEK